MKRTLKTILAGIAVGAMALSLAACGTASKSDSSQLSKGPVTLRMYWWGGDARHERTKQAIALFEKKYPNITVKPEFTDWTGYWEKLATSTAGKNMPDVVQMDQLYLASYADRGTLLDLSKQKINTSDIDSGLLDAGKWKNGLYAIPLSTSITAMLTNTTVLDKLGVALPDTSKGWTYEDYQAWGKKVADASGGQVYGVDVYNNEFQLQQFIRQNGENLYDGTKVVVKPKTLSAFFQLGLTQQQSGAAAPATAWAESLTLPIDQSRFGTSADATLFTSATLNAAFAKATGDNIALLPLPTLKGGTAKFDYYKPGMYWAASSQSKHPAEAALLIDFLLNDPGVAKLFGSERGLPASSKALDAIRSTLTPEETAAVKYSESRKPFLGKAPSITPNGASDITAMLQRYQQEVNFQRTTPDKAASDMIAELQKSIDAAK